MATLVHLRHGLTHDVVAAWFGVHRSTITRSVAEVRPLLAERGCQVNDGVRLRTIADVVAYLGHHPRALMDATEVRVRRPVEGRAGRDRFVSGKSRLNTMKAPVLCDPAGRLLFCGETRPGSMHDLTQARTAGLVDLLLQAPLGVQVLSQRRLPRTGRRHRRRGNHPQTHTAKRAEVATAERHRRTSRGPQATLLPTDPHRARHRTPQELADPGPLPRPTRTLRRHHPRHRQPAVRPPAHRSH